MIITIDIRPEVETELIRQAATQGCAPEALAATLLEEAVQFPAGTPSLGRGASRDRLEVTLREMAQFSHKIPVLPDEALSRGSLYRDYD